MDKNNKFQCLFDAYVLAYPTKSWQICQEEELVVIRWNAIKNEDLQVKVENCLWELKAISATRKGSLLTFWTKQTSTPDRKTSENVPVKRHEYSVLQSNEVTDAQIINDSMHATSKPSRVATAQLHLQS